MLSLIPLEAGIGIVAAPGSRARITWSQPLSAGVSVSCPDEAPEVAPGRLLTELMLIDVPPIWPISGSGKPARAVDVGADPAGQLLPAGPVRARRDVLECGPRWFVGRRARRRAAAATARERSGGDPESANGSQAIPTNAMVDGHDRALASGAAEIAASTRAPRPSKWGRAPCRPQ